VVIFSKTYCPYCVKAKEAVKEAGAKVAGFEGAHVIELNTRSDGSDIQSALAALTGRRTVPNVFIGGQPVGGGDETARYLSQGVLPQMIRAAPDQLRAAKGPAAVDNHAITVGHIEAVESEGKLATFGAGCFWGVELAFQRQPGVYKTEVGYSNGSFTPVAYRQICSGSTGHAEVVRVWYRPEEVNFKDLLALWESRHDPTSLNKQGNDRGTQYRSAIFYTDDEQRDAAFAWKDDAGKRLGKTIVTEIAPESGYVAAEEYHQRYLENRGQSAAKGASDKIRCYG
jgi:peptide-methionine (S)-S-oxide reductase